MEYKGITLPEPFVKKARRECIRSIGQYNGETHRFFPPAMDPTRNAVETIRESYNQYNLFPDGDEFDAILKQIRLSADTAPEVISGSISDSELEIFDIIKIIEEDQSTSTLLYVGSKKFVVLESSKASIIFNDVLICNTMPITEGEREEFSVIRNGKPFSPEEFGNFQFPFYTKRIVRLEILRSPEIYKVIDEDDRFGRYELQPMTQPAEDVLNLLINDIADSRSRYDAPVLPVSGQYPEYDWLLEVAKRSGVRTFVLNTLIERIESGVETRYAFVEDDWKKSQKWIDEQERIKNDQLTQECVEAEKDLNDILKKSLRQRRVLLLFKAETKVPEEVDGHIHQLITKLDGLAEQGFGHEKGWAASQYALAKQKTKPKPGENARTGAVLAGIVTVIAFVGFTWLSAKNSMDRFENTTSVVPEMIQNEQFKEAKALVADAREAFRPGYISFIVSTKTKRLNSMIEVAITDYVTQTVEQVNIMKTANRGKIDDYCWELIKKAMEYRPEDSRLVELRNEYIAQ